MTISVICEFEVRISELVKYRDELIDPPGRTSKDSSRAVFFAEALFFRMFREYERFISRLFLCYCCEWPTPSGKLVTSLIKVQDPNEAHLLVKSGNRFVDWAKPEEIRERSKVFLRNGFPIADIIDPFNSDISSMYRIRNHIAHDSKESRDGFQKVLDQFLTTPPVGSVSAGEFLLLEKRSKGRIARQQFVSYFLDKQIEIARACRSV
jgi:hypothetical protein